MNKYTIRVLAILIVTLVAIPMARTYGIFRSIDDEGKWIFPMRDIRPAVQMHRARQWRLQRRLYSRAIEIYRDLLRQGMTGLAKPDINNVDSITLYLDPDRFEAYRAQLEEQQLRGAAPPLLYQEIHLLPYQARVRLMGFVSSGRCHPSLRLSYLSGFYELCLRLLEEGLPSAPVRGPSLDLRKGIRGLYFNRRAPQQSIKLRLKMMEQAKDRSRRRESVPSQPPRLRRTFEGPEYQPQ